MPFILQNPVFNIKIRPAVADRNRVASNGRESTAMHVYPIGMGTLPCFDGETVLKGFPRFLRRKSEYSVL